jgi:ketosteroid isomerase-like protein
MQINDPKVLAEIQASVEAYMAALEANDLERLDAMFWDSDDVVRFGARESLFGIVQIRAFRGARRREPEPLQIDRMVVTAFGNRMGTVSMLFSRRSAPERVGRWTQNWVKIDRDWKITAAHVSSIADSAKPD